MLNGQDMTCPVCEKALDADDDIVVCPHCGAPHHRRCYAQNNACFFEAHHAEGNDWRQFVNKEEKNGGPETKACPVCGQENETTLFFCKRCGENLLDPSADSPKGNKPPQVGFPFGGQGVSFSPIQLDPYAGMNPQDKIGEHTVEELAAYVGQSSGYYLPRFKELEDGGKNVFNYAGAFFSPFWCFFRRMTWPGVLFFLLLLASTFVRTYFSFLYLSKTPGFYESLLVSILQLCLVGGQMFLSGFLANRLYYNHCRKQIYRIKETRPDNLLESLTTLGGVRLQHVYAAIASFSVLSVVIALLIQFLA